MRVSDLGETALLARMGPLLPRGPRTSVPTGDDAMVLDPSDGRVCVTTDVLVEGHHFRRDWSEADEVGRRAVAQNLADVAAMGAVPLSIVVALAVPAETEVDWVLGLARGLGDACRDAGAGVDGGDLSTGEQIVVAVTAFGDLEGRAPVLRSGAQTGDVVAHVGDRGRSAAGLALLTAGWGAGDDEPQDDVASWAVQGFRTPAPPLTSGPAAAAAGASAMADVSDGLLRDAGRVARASGVSVDLTLDGCLGRWERRLAASPALRDLVGVDARTAVLTGGEDHGLLATFPPGAALPPGWEPIGTVADGPAGRVTLDGVDPRAAGVEGLGWDHFGG